MGWYERAAHIAAQEGHPWPDLFARQIRLESAGFDPDVIACRRVSSAGAEGIAQIMRIYHPAVDPCDPEAALHYAARLMISHYQRYGRWDFALAAYNAGAGAVDKYGGVPPYAETQRYVALLLGEGNGDEPPPGSEQASSAGLGVLIGAVVVLFALGMI